MVIAKVGGIAGCGTGGEAGYAGHLNALKQTTLKDALAKPALRQKWAAERRQTTAAIAPVAAVLVGAVP